ncbi:MAG: adenylate kinase family protein, partial [Myxococcota bacterium]
VASRLVEADCTGGALLDGFPRTVPQAEMLYAWLESQDRAVGAVINLAVDDAILVARLSGRRTCLSCGATYHVEHNPPADADTCDRCGGGVVQRKDDSEDTVRARLTTYANETAPVLAWLTPRSKVHSIHGNQAITKVQSDIEEALRS